jgi:hypothetical protein
MVKSTLSTLRQGLFPVRSVLQSAGKPLILIDAENVSLWLSPLMAACAFTDLF